MVDGYPQAEVQSAGVEFVLAYHDAAVEVRLIADQVENYAKPLISKGPDVAIRMVHCPAIIKEAQHVGRELPGTSPRARTEPLLGPIV